MEGRTNPILQDPSGRGRGSKMPNYKNKSEFADQNYSGHKANIVLSTVLDIPR